MGFVIYLVLCIRQFKKIASVQRLFQSYRATLELILESPRNLLPHFFINFEQCDARVRRPDGLSDGRTGGKDTVSTRSTICSTAVLCTVLGKQAAALHTLGLFAYFPLVIAIFKPLNIK